jgi:hypothetical protein
MVDNIFWKVSDSMHMLKWLKDLSSKSISLVLKILLTCNDINMYQNLVILHYITFLEIPQKKNEA